MKPIFRTPQLLVAMVAAAAIIAGCGGGQQSSVVPGAAPAKDALQPAGSVGHRVPFYSTTYLKEHPELVRSVGDHAKATNRGALASGSGQLIYHNGPIQKYPKIYLIFWGFTGSNDTTHDPNGMATYLTNYVNSLGGSGIANVSTQYNESARGYITNPSNQAGGVWYDSGSTPPTTYAESDIQAEANRAVAHFGYNADGNYFVVTPHNYTTSGFGTQFCAFHNTMSGGSGPIAYTDLPYVPDAGSGCGMGNVNSPGTLDGASIVGGHEIEETITDPGAGNGWIDATGAENGDKCAWVGDANVTMGNGAVFPNQPEWSNAIAGCTFTYGSNPTPAPSPTPTPVPTPRPTATPTPGPTPTPVGGCSGQLFLNAGFESGTASWSSTSGVINTDGTYSHSGLGYAWLDGYGSTHTDTVSQSVSIKAGCKATLTYWQHITTAETTTAYAYDTLAVSVNGSTKQTLSNLNKNSAYVQQSVDISAYAGQTVTIKWTGTEDASLATNFFIDDTAVTLH